ncbi:hypothetical protein [Streptacidiphilus melanogenes]|uniref:hypothetical protein n=1 Tax=Streptacidiphilus melanogenes TaxID=411235 RepID=UPI0005A6402B|nr:hypothetical protein [Streptacidiphilus melanogenes]
MNDHQASAVITPTIILVGGPMTVDDGSSLDSRQPVTGDPASHVTHSSLATSQLWWLTASSLVGRLLDSAGDNAFALLLGNRTVVELQPDDTLRRTGLRSVLQGGSSELELIRTSMDEALPDGYTFAHRLQNWNNEVMGTIGFKPGDPGSRWRFLKGNEFYLSAAGKVIGASVVIDTSETVTGSDRLSSAVFTAFEERRLYSPDTVLVMPHTHHTESLLRGYLAWLRAGRPDTTEMPTPALPWDPAAPPDPIRYTCPVPIEARFGVTGLIRDGQWSDPSDLEAARSLLQARYDLKIGIWDLVGNPTLRRALLASTPHEPGPTHSAPVPAGSAQRAQKRVAAKMSQKADQELALRRIADQLEPLEALGWKPNEHTGSTMVLPLTAEYRLWPDSDPFPLVRLEFEIVKRQSTVRAFTSMYNQVDVTDYVTARRVTFEEIASPDGCQLERDVRPVLWRAPGGWADDGDWQQRASSLVTRTILWRNALQDLCSQCEQVLAKRRGTMFGGSPA